MSDKRDYMIIRKRLKRRKKKLLKIISKFQKFTLIERFFEVVAHLKMSDKRDYVIIRKRLKRG